MQRFAELYAALDRTTSTRTREALLADYFRDTPAADAAWGLYLLAGRRIKRLVAPSALWDEVVARSGWPPWLCSASWSEVGDLAECATLLLEDQAAPGPSGVGLADFIQDSLLPLELEPRSQRARALAGWCRQLSAPELFVALKLLTGALRVGVSQRTVIRALAGLAEDSVEAVAGRIAGGIEPDPELLPRLLGRAPGQTASPAPGSGSGTSLQPYPFFLASPHESPQELGPVEDWLLEWKWDGIRAQAIRREGEAQALWSRGEELLSGRFPEVEQVLHRLPEGTVLDGELLAFRDERPLPFAVLQQRIQRKTVSARLRRQAPVVFMAYDLLELAGEDWRPRPLSERRTQLEELLEQAPPSLRLSPRVVATSWEEAGRLREAARQGGSEGLMLKRQSSPYRAGRRRGDWWKWKLDPFAVDVVLTHAQPGTGRRSSLLTDYTFAVWDGEELVTIAKAYSGLSDAELEEIDRWARAHTTARFGPVRKLEPRLVFELAFEGLRASSRHRAGIALRFPRIARWRRDKPATEAERLADVRALLPPEPAPAATDPPHPQQLSLFPEP